jgi:hypothetical protein
MLSKRFGGWHRWESQVVSMDWQDIGVRVMSGG